MAGNPIRNSSGQILYEPVNDSQTGRTLYKDVSNGKLYTVDKLPMWAKVQLEQQGKTNPEVRNNLLAQGTEQSAQYQANEKAKKQEARQQKLNDYKQQFQQSTQDLKEGMGIINDNYINPLVSGAKEGVRNVINTLADNVANIRGTIQANQQASKEKAHANRQAEIAENAAAETGTYKQKAAQKANRDERVEASKDAATNAASQARAQIANGAARAMGGGAASLQGATTATQAADTSASITENRQRADTQAQTASELARTQAQQSANAEQMRQQGDEAAYAISQQNEANTEKAKLALGQGTSALDSGSLNPTDTTTQINQSSLSEEEKTLLKNILQKLNTRV